MNEKDLTISFFQGTDNLIQDNELGLKQIKQKIADLSNIKNINFLFGAGVSSGSIPTMKEMVRKIENNLENEMLVLFQELKSNNDENLEKMLGVLYSRRAAILGVGKDITFTNSLIEVIENQIFKEINIDVESKKIISNCIKAFIKK